MHIQDQTVLKEDCQAGSSQKREDSDGVFSMGFYTNWIKMVIFPEFVFL